MNARRIVLVMVEPPIPFGNAAARWYYALLKGLVERGYRVDAFATCVHRRDMEAAHDLFPAPAYSLRCYEHARRGALASKIETLRRPHSYLFSPDFQRDLRAALAKPFDLLHLEMLWSGWMGLEHRARALLNIHYLFRIDMADHQPAALLERLAWSRTLQAERHLLQQYPRICTLTPRLSAAVQEINPNAKLFTVPLGMDLTRYFFRPSQPTAPIVTLIGSYDWMPTYSAGKRLVERLWPAIRQRMPEAKLRLVGRGALAAFGELTGRPDIEIHADVPDTIPYFRDSTVMLYAPGRGSGMKVKVLEAFALGLPVVTTAEGVEGIPAIDGVHAGICEDDPGLIGRTIDLLASPDTARNRSVAARTLVEQHCAAEVALDILGKVYVQLLDRPSKDPRLER